VSAKDAPFLAPLGEFFLKPGKKVWSALEEIALHKASLANRVIEVRKRAEEKRARVAAKKAAKRARHEGDKSVADAKPAAGTAGDQGDSDDDEEEAEAGDDGGMDENED
jgi:hypothetical protein